MSFISADDFSGILNMENEQLMVMIAPRLTDELEPDEYLIDAYFAGISAENDDLVFTVTWVTDMADGTIYLDIQDFIDAGYVEA